MEHDGLLKQISSGNNLPHDLFGIYVADKQK